MEQVSAGSVPDSLLYPNRVWSRKEVLSRPCPIPKWPGIYAWYFREIPPCIVADGCIRLENLSLLYVGISPSSPPKDGKPSSNQTIYDRIRFHYAGNSYGSTLRLTLGCLLSEKLGIELRRVGSGKRMTFGAGEKTLSEWMGENAFVAWIHHNEPWLLEEQLIHELFLPLNLDMNDGNPNHQIVSGIRSQAKANARTLPVVPGKY